MRFVLRLLINACALWVATQLVSGVTFDGDVLPFLGVALIFGIVNATIRPVFKILLYGERCFDPFVTWCVRR